MLNFYSCGCTSRGHVPITARCGEHNGYIVALQKDQVTKKRSFRSDGIHIRHHPLSDVTEACLEKGITFDLICSYPEHGSFYAHDSLVENGWRRKLNPLMPDLYSVLREDGHLLFVVEQTMLARALYDSLMAGFVMNSICIVSSTIAFEPIHEKIPEMYTYKFAILLSKNGSDFKLPDYARLADLPSLLKKLKPRRVLETSCIHTPFLHIAPKTLGVCENYNRYVEIKRKLCQNSQS